MNLQLENKTPHSISDEVFRNKGVAGARHVAYGKIPTEFETPKNLTKLNTSAGLLIETVPTLVRIIDSQSVDLSTYSHKIKSSDFTEISLSRIALVTEIALG